MRFKVCYCDSSHSLERVELRTSRGKNFSYYMCVVSFVTIFDNYDTTIKRTIHSLNKPMFNNNNNNSVTLLTIYSSMSLSDCSNTANVQD